MRTTRRSEGARSWDRRGSMSGARSRGEGTKFRRTAVALQPPRLGPPRPAHTMAQELVKDVTGALASLGGKEEPPFDISEFEVEHFVGALWGCTLAWDPRTAQVWVCVLCAYDPGSTRAGMLVGGSTGRLRQVRVSGGNETLGSRREDVELQGTKYAIHTRASELQTRQDSRRERRLTPPSFPSSVALRHKHLRYVAHCIPRVSN